MVIRATLKVLPVGEDECQQVNSRTFIEGKPYIHPSGEVVKFDDDNWIVQAGRGRQTTIYFQKLPLWLRRPAKLAVAHAWLEVRRSRSYLLTLMCSYRRLAKWLPKFTAKSIDCLTSKHEALLNKRLKDELDRSNDVLENASAEAGSPIRVRQRRQVCKDAQVIGPKTVCSFVSAVNLAVRLSEEIDGLDISVRLEVPRAADDEISQRGVGSADPARVLTPEQVAELERALSQDLRRYRKARVIIDRNLSGLNLATRKPGKPDPIFDVERYFGLNGHREHKAVEVAALRGLSSAGSTNVPQLIRRFLSKRIGPELATKIVKLRSRFPLLEAQKKFEELEADRRYIHDVLGRLNLTSTNENKYCLERYFGLNGFRPHSLSAIAKQLNLQTERSVFYRVHESLVTLVGETKAKRLLAVRDRLLYYLTRAIKAQAIRVQLSAARRISAVLDLPVTPRIKVHTDEARRIVEVQFRAGKTWGDEGIEEWVPCVDKYGEIAEDAINTAQELTKDLRLVAQEDDSEVLFIIPDNSFECAVRLTDKVLHEYIYTNQKGKDAGILRRYGLENLKDFELHDVRVTNATLMMEAGATIQDVSRYLGHFAVNGSTTMAAVFYVAGGTPAMRQRTADVLRRGAATGFYFDAVARLKIEAMGDGAKSLPVLPNQLSYEEARQRISTADIVEDIPFSVDEAVRLFDQKVMVNVNATGGCLLQATSGHCNTANPCAIGIVRIGEDPIPGFGCKYLVLMPHSVDQLGDDVAVMNALLEKMTGDEYAVRRAHTIAKRDHWLTLIERAKSLNSLRG